MQLVIEELKGLTNEMVLLTGFNLDLLVDKDDKDDIAPTPPQTPQTKLGDVYEIGKHRVLCGSSTLEEDVTKLMNGELAEMVWTDPPYNVNYEGGTGLKIQNDQMDDSSFYKFLKDFYTETKKVMHKGCPIYVAHADSEGVNFRKALKDTGIELKQCVIWVKSSLVLGRQDYQWQHEPILYGWNPGASHRWYGMYDKTTVIDDEVDIKKLKKEELQELVTHLRNERKTTIIRHDKPVRSGEHPTMKPVGLIVKFLQNSSRRGDLVYDGFGGSGSTLIASEKLDRRCYMMELDPVYVDVIVQRYVNFTGDTKVIKNGEATIWEKTK
jgi:DNA modification methylase